MSEFWVSKKRYWCKYCGISIADDAPSRQHHEGGLRHKGNVDRYIRDIYKTGEKRKKDAAEEERELKRINAAAEQAYAKDISSGAAAGGSSSSSSAPASRPAPAAKPPPAKSLDKFANYSTAESLGFVDEAVVEAERRQTEGFIGNWEVVLPTPSSKPKEKEDTGKRVLQAAQTEERAAAESSRGFRVGERKVGAGLEEIWEPEVPIRLKVKSEQPQDSATPAPGVQPKVEIDYGLPKATEMPVWKAKGWSKPGEVKEEDKDSIKQEGADAVKEEGEERSSASNPEPISTDAVPPPIPSPPAEAPVKAEPEEPKLEEPMVPNSLFRKRKGAPSTAGTRNQKKR
ncbi:U1 small nuclear ribonucleoprotein C [Ceratobasidium sp. AG-Ba]|nr:U1 small nuclear ribonucleoprotein C [Ceratobasidium sp. AG-Ba]QRW08102.1 U1 small nuclear ribonucleoprotein C [Ceratobasidium sp. AG-Ba]